MRSFGKAQACFLLDTYRDDPRSGVPREEFDEMVKDRSRYHTATPSKPKGGRRSGTANGSPASTSTGTTKPPKDSDDASDGETKPKKPRNRRHGRPR